MSDHIGCEPILSPAQIRVLTHCWPVILVEARDRVCNIGQMMISISHRSSVVLGYLLIVHLLLSLLLVISILRTTIMMSWSTHEIVILKGWFVCHNHPWSRIACVSLSSHRLWNSTRLLILIMLLIEIDASSFRVFPITSLILGKPAMMPIWMSCSSWHHSDITINSSHIRRSSLHH